MDKRTANRELHEEKAMNFIDKAFQQNLTGDAFLQAMASIYSEPEVYKILNEYPTFVSDVILIIDYDTALQMDGLDDVINGNLSDSYAKIVDALERCGAKHEAGILKKAKELSDTDKDRYDEEFDSLNDQLALHSDYSDFWDIVRAYIDKDLVFLHAATSGTSQSFFIKYTISISCFPHSNMGWS